MDIRKLIEETNGQIFHVRFRKRTTHEIREMTCRLGVTKHLVDCPTKAGVDGKANNLVTVFDMNAQGYRSISLEGVIGLKINGEWIDV